jgi:L-rhamnose mutarotase
MRSVFTLNLKDDPVAIDTYRRYHREVWPEVVSSLRGVGVRQMDIHLLGRRLVMIVEMRDGLDYRVAFKAHGSSSDRVAEWERLMRTLQEPIADARAGEWWSLMECVFHMDQHEPAVAHHAEPARLS